VKPQPEQEIGKGKAGPGRGKKTTDNISRLSHGTSAAYLVAKLKRDAPEFAERRDKAGEARYPLTSPALLADRPQTLGEAVE
jgi:hypothetical protein